MKFILAAGLAALPLLAMAAALLLLPRVELAGFAASRASAALGREVTVESLRITPGANFGVTLRGLRVPNIPGGTRPLMVELAALDAELALGPLLRGEAMLHRMAIQGLSVLLERNAERQANWHFGPKRPAAEGPPDRSGLPEFRALHVTGSEVTFRTTSGQMLTTRIDAANLSAPGPHSPVEMLVAGSYNAVPVVLAGTLGSIATLRDARLPFPIDLRATARDTVLTLRGTGTDPLNFDGIEGDVTLDAPTPNAILAIAGAGEAPAVPLRLGARLEHRGGLWRLTALEGALDGHALSGALQEFTEGSGGQADALAVDLDFTKLDFNRLLPREAGRRSDDTDLPLAVAAHPDPLMAVSLSVADLTFAQLRATDVELHAAVQPGRIAVERLALRSFGARIQASGHLEEVERGVGITADVSMRSGDLETLRRAFGLRPLPLSGPIEARLAVTGQGRTLNAAARGAHVTAVVAMTGGNVAREVIEMASTDIRALFRTARGDTRLSCLLGVLDMRAGRGEVAPLRLRAATGTISGLASFDINRRTLDLVIGSQRATTDFFALDIPVRVSGAFAGPAIRPAQWSASGRARLSAGDAVAPLPPALRDYARRNPCFFGGGR